MDKRRILGIIFVVISGFIGFFNISLTGAVIGIGFKSYLGLVGVGFFIVGIFLIFTSATLERRLVVDEDVVLPEQVVNQIRIFKNPTVVLDTSLIASYSEDGVRDLLKRLEKYGDVIVPDSVLRELSGNWAGLRRVVEQGSSEPTKGYEKFKNRARELLENSRKNFYHNNVIPIILGEKKPPTSRREAEPYVEAVKKLIRYVSEKGLALTRENLVRESEKHWKVSETDVDVLAATLAEAEKYKGPVVIGEKDVDFEDALKQAGSAHLHYMNAYGESS